MALTQLSAQTRSAAKLPRQRRSSSETKGPLAPFSGVEAEGLCARDGRDKGTLGRASAASGGSENFDVSIPAAFTEVALLLVKPANWAPCSDLDGQTSVSEEYPWNFMYWVR